MRHCPIRLARAFNHAPGAPWDPSAARVRLRGVFTDPVEVLTRLAARTDRAGRLVHVEQLPDRPARHVDWPAWVHPDLVAALMASGVARPWSHQVAAAEHARAGRHVVLATSTASGKSLAYLLPALTALAEAGEPARRRDRRPSVLYLSPTKALARDQFGRVTDLVGTAGLPWVRAAAVDGDNSTQERMWAREHASFVLANPDICHRTLLPGHQRWSRFWAGLTYVVIDECHHYRGVFGSNVAQVLRRLRRIAAHHGADPTFVLASATVSEPERTASRLTGLPVVPVVNDGSPRRGAQVALWEPPLIEGGGENGAPTRRPASVETADLLTDLVVAGVRTVAFVRSRRTAETVALGTQRRLAEVEPALVSRVDAYRGGYLPEERRAIERALGSGELLGLASTNALELGIDVAGLDAVLTTGYPGTRAALWQQFGRAGRSGQSSLGVLIARDDPLDSYLIAHPEVLLGAPVEATVIDPDNPYVLGPHLATAAAELPLREDDLELFGPLAAAGVQALVGAGLLRRRSTGWFWTKRERAGDLADIRSTGGRPVQIVVEGSGRLLGTVDASAAHVTVHTGAVYLHHGDTYVVQDFDLEDAAAVVRRADPDWTTTARSVTEIRVVDTEVTQPWGRADLCFGTVMVTDQVVGYLRRRLGSGEVLGEEPLDLPPRVLHTKAVWWTLDPSQLRDSGVPNADLPGAAHAAEHAAIGLLPLFATCDRWDIGGVSTALHPDTGRLSVFVHDGHPGGAGFAERGFRTAAAWLRATAQAIDACACEDGCPSCVQSPKCGNQNHPLDKRGAVALLHLLLAGLPSSTGTPDTG